MYSLVSDILEDSAIQLSYSWGLNASSTQFLLHRIEMSRLSRMYCITNYFNNPLASFAMILTDFHKVSVADASFGFSCTKWLRRLLGTLRDLIKVHFACFRVVTDNFLPGSTDQWKWGQLGASLDLWPYLYVKSGGCQVFVQCLNDANYSFIICLKNLSEPSAAPINVRARNLSSTSILVQWGEVPDTDKNGIILSYTFNYKANPESSL